MNFTVITHTKNNFLSIRYTNFSDIDQYVFESFYVTQNNLQSAGLHILTYGVNNLTLAVI